jgi:hypothetical protein
MSKPGKGEDSSPPRRHGPIVYDGVTFPTRKALAHHLAQKLGRSVNTLNKWLWEANDEASVVVSRHHIACRPENIKTVYLAYDGKTFHCREALTRYLAPLVGRTPYAVRAMLIKHGDDVAAALAYHREISTVVAGKTYRSRAHFMRALVRRYLVPEATLKTWIYSKKLPLEEVIERARAWRRQHKPTTPVEEIVLFGWRFRSFTALWRYYTGAVAYGAISAAVGVSISPKASRAVYFCHWQRGSRSTGGSANSMSGTVSRRSARSGCQSLACR